MRAAGVSAGAPAARPVLEFCAEHGPPELAADARGVLAGGFEERVRAYWATGDYDYLARAAGAPYARLLRATGPAPARARCACSTAPSALSPGKWAGSAAPRAGRRIPRSCRPSRRLRTRE